MKLEIGTKVKFLNDIGGGVVKGFNPDEMVLVETDDGFEMPVKASDLIIAEPTVYGFDGETSQPPAAVPTREDVKMQLKVSFEEKKYAAQKGKVLLALVPENEKLLHVSKFALYLINDGNYYFNYVLSFKDNNVHTLVGSGSIEPDTKMEIQSFTQNSIAKIKEFRIQGIFYKHGLLNPVKPVDMTYNIEHVSFYKIGFFTDNDYFNKKALVFKKDEEFDLKETIDKLDDTTINKIAAYKEKKQPEKKPKSSVNKDIEEVDLHIEEIVENHADLSNGEIINIQLARFETALETVLHSKTQRIVFIHGVGNGRLKLELRKKLDRKYPDLRYQDASFKEYGFGATMVYLK